MSGANCNHNVLGGGKEGLKCLKIWKLKASSISFQWQCGQDCVIGLEHVLSDKW